MPIQRRRLYSNLGLWAIERLHHLKDKPSLVPLLISRDFILEIDDIQLFNISCYRKRIFSFGWYSISCCYAAGMAAYVHFVEHHHPITDCWRKFVNIHRKMKWQRDWWSNQVVLPCSKWVLSIQWTYPEGKLVLLSQIFCKLKWLGSWMLAIWE